MGCYGKPNEGRDGRRADGGNITGGRRVGEGREEGQAT